MVAKPCGLGPVTKKNRSAQNLAKLRAKSLTPERRKEISKNALKVRWDKYRENKAKENPTPQERRRI